MGKTYSIFDIEGLKWDGININFGTDGSSAGIFVEKEYIDAIAFNGIRSHGESGCACYDPDDCEEWSMYKCVTNDFGRVDLAIQLDGLDGHDLETILDANEDGENIVQITFWREVEESGFALISVEDIVIMNYVRLGEYEDAPEYGELTILLDDEEGAIHLRQGYSDPLI